MAEITVREYAERFKTSVQSVYNRIKRGSLKAVERDGQKFVIIDDEELKTVENELQIGLKESLKPVLNDGMMQWIDFLAKELDRLQEETAKLLKENRRLVKKLEKCNKEQKKVLVSYIQELKQIQLMHQPSEEIIEAEVKQKKKKKKSK